MRDAATSHLPPAFRRLAWSNLAAQSAEQIALAAAALTAVLVLDAGEVGSGTLQTALTLPFLVVSIQAGLLADRVSRPPSASAGSRRWAGRSPPRASPDRRPENRRAAAACRRSGPA